MILSARAGPSWPRRWAPRACAAAGALFLSYFSAGCGGASAEAGKAGGRWGGGEKIRFPVETAVVQARRVEYTLSAVGSVEVFERVQVTARVGGLVEQVLFAEGKSVKAGEPLLAIDQERYDLSLRGARAEHEKALAAQAEAQASLDRREAAARQSRDLLSAEDLAAWRIRVRQADAAAEEAAVRLEKARLDQRDSRAPAPIAGVIETRTVETGQFVTAGTLVATLARRDPLLLRFLVPQEEAGALRPGLVAGFEAAGAAGTGRATITHVASSADQQSRMVAVVATVDADDSRRLAPGAFARVTVTVDANDAAALIPALAVRPSERGLLAFVVEGESARERILTLGMRTADGMVEVKAGVRAGEAVVVRGGEALTDGAAVRVEKPAPATAGKSGSPPPSPPGAKTPAAVSQPAPPAG
ncbi:MAG: efflux RND transporter periplasmic adaptor subunit, partial [Planctomycetes bacterium]|nr:efflux RND transporter periplasmic adaptor subunit [Planctomycetota bacterium]